MPDTNAQPTGTPVKIFCIGFNKTGTTSLHVFFRNCGLASLHNDSWPMASGLPRNAAWFERADCYSDGQEAQFHRLSAWFPKALFVLNVREERSWLRSRVKHVFRHMADGGDGAAKPPGGWMARQFNAAPQIAIDDWILRRRLYHRMARHFFAGSDRFLELDVTADADWPHKLGRFMRQHGHAVADDIGTPHANRREGTVFSDFPQIEAWMDLVDERLAAIGPEAEPGDHVARHHGLASAE